MNDTAINFRDVGKVVNGLIGRTFLEEGILLRGGKIDLIDGTSLFGEPRTIINLRVGKDPEFKNIRQVHLPADGNFRIYDVAKGSNRKWIVAFLRALADPETETPIFVHCAAGRDRTGLAVGALLMVLEVPLNIIRDEYALSEGGLQESLFNTAIEEFAKVGYFRGIKVDMLRQRFLFTPITSEKIE